MAEMLARQWLVTAWLSTWATAGRMRVVYVQRWRICLCEAMRLQPLTTTSRLWLTQRGQEVVPAGQGPIATILHQVGKAYKEGQGCRGGPGGLDISTPRKWAWASSPRTLRL